MTLVGFFRGRRFNLYAGEERVTAVDNGGPAPEGYPQSRASE